jgi:nucleolin
MSTNTLFLSGLPYTSNEEDILKFLEGCGEILEVKMPRYQDSGKSRGYAHVTFKDSEAA